MVRNTPDGHHRGLVRIRPFPAGGGPMLSGTFILTAHRSRPQATNLLLRSLPR